MSHSLRTRPRRAFSLCQSVAATRRSQLAASVIALAVAMHASSDARAQDDDADVGLPAVQFHGFASQGFILTTGNNYLAESKQGSFEFAEVGLNATAQLGERLRVGMQLFSRDLGPLGDYRAHLDWFYLDYLVHDAFGIRAGRVKLPFGLYNDTADIDAARNSVLLPQSMYPTENRDFLLAQTGVELYGYVPLGGAGALDYRVYGGTIYIEAEDSPATGTFITRLTAPYVVGGRLLWETPLQGLRVGGSVQALRLESDIFIDGDEPTTVGVDIPAVLWVTSAEYLNEDWLFAAEYSRWHIEREVTGSMTIPEEKVVNERTYALATYRVLPWFQPGAYYSLLFRDVEDRKGRDAQQHDTAVTFRFDINAYWLFKLEAHYLWGTAALRSDLNNNQSRDQLAREWALFLAKTTATF